MIQPAFKRRVPHFQSIPLRVVLVVPFVVEVVAVVWLTTYFAYRNGQDAVTELADQLMVEVSDRVEQSLTADLQMPLLITQNTAAATRLGILDWRRETTVERYFWQQLRGLQDTHDEINGIAIADHQANFLAVETGAANSWLVRLQNRSTHSWLHHYRLNLEGKRTDLIDQTEFDPNHSLISDRTLEPVKQADQGVWRLFVTPGLDRPTLLAAYIQPFYDQRNTRRGVTGVTVNLSQMGQHLEQLKIGQTGQAFVIERSGLLLTTSTGEYPLLKPTRADGAASNRAFYGERLVERRLKANRSKNSVTRHTAQSLVDRFGSFESIASRQRFSFAAEGKRFFVQVTPLPVKNLDWLAVVVIPESDFAAQIERNYLTMIALCGMALLGAIVLGLLTAHGIARPILRLSRASRDLMLGKLDTPIEPDSRITELAILGHTFDEMTEHLQASFEQVKQALQESKEKFTTVFRTCPDPIVITTLADGMVLEVNESFLRLFGRSREQVVNHTSLELAIWQRAADRERFLQEIQTHGRVYNQEFSALTHHGTEAIVLMSSEVIELDGKKCLVTVAKDITERKRLEEALRQSEAKLQRVLDTTTASICCFRFDHDENLTYDYFSPSYGTLFGFTPEELIADIYLWRSRVHPDDHDQVLGILPLRLTEGPLTAEYRFWRKDGTLLWISEYTTIRRSEAGFWLVTAVAVDVTDRKQAEADLRISEKLFRTAFEMAAIVMNISALTGHLLKVNPAFCQMLGYTEAELLQLRYQDITHLGDLDREQEFERQLLAGEIASFQIQKRYIHKTGYPIWALLSVSLVRDSEHRPLYFIVLTQPISAHENTSVRSRETVGIVEVEMNLQGYCDR